MENKKFINEKSCDINFLELIPCHKSEFCYHQEDDGKITVLQEYEGMLYYFRHKLMHKAKGTRVHLDELGSYIWNLMDGQRSLINIADILKKQFGEKVEPLYSRLVIYVSTLEGYGVVELRKESSKNFGDKE